MEDGNLYCSNCGTKVDEDLEFCNSCGYYFAQDARKNHDQKVVENRPSPLPQYSPVQQPLPTPYPYPMGLNTRQISPNTAAVLAFFVMGLGHIYIGRVVLGMIIFIGAIIATIVALELLFLVPGLYLLLALFVYWSLQLFDAHRQAVEYNKSINESGKAPW